MLLSYAICSYQSRAFFRATTVYVENGMYPMCAYSRLRIQNITLEPASGNTRHVHRVSSSISSSISSYSGRSIELTPERTCVYFQKNSLYIHNKSTPGRPAASSALYGAHFGGLCLLMKYSVQNWTFAPNKGRDIKDLGALASAEGDWASSD